MDRGIRQTLFAFSPEEIGAQRPVTDDAFEKARSFGGDRSAAGKYAASIRWANHVKGGGDGGMRTTEQKLAEGPKVLTFGRDEMGMPRMASAEELLDRFGDSPAQWEQYFLVNHNIRLSIGGFQGPVGRNLKGPEYRDIPVTEKVQQPWMFLRDVSVRPLLAAKPAEAQREFVETNQKGLEATLGILQALDDVANNVTLAPNASQPMYVEVPVITDPRDSGLGGFHAQGQGVGFWMTVGAGTVVALQERMNFGKFFSEAVSAKTTAGEQVLRGDTAFSMPQLFARQEYRTILPKLTIERAQEILDSRLQGKGFQALVPENDFQENPVKWALTEDERTELGRALIRRSGYGFMVHELGHAIDSRDRTGTERYGYFSSGIDRAKELQGTTKDGVPLQENYRQWSRGKLGHLSGSVSQYGATVMAEHTAELFAAWFLLSRAEGVTVRQTRNPNRMTEQGGVRPVSTALDEMFKPFLRHYEDIIKQASVIGDRLADFPMTHPVIVFAMLPLLMRIVNSDGFVRMMEDEAEGRLEKAKSFGGDRSAAGRYAASIRWAGHIPEDEAGQRELLGRMLNRANQQRRKMIAAAKGMNLALSDPTQPKTSPSAYGLDSVFNGRHKIGENKVEEIVAAADAIAECGDVMLKLADEQLIRDGVYTREEVAAARATIDMQEQARNRWSDLQTFLLSDAADTESPSITFADGITLNLGDAKFKPVLAAAADVRQFLKDLDIYVANGHRISGTAGTVSEMSQKGIYRLGRAEGEKKFKFTDYYDGGWEVPALREEAARRMRDLYTYLTMATQLDEVYEALIPEGERDKRFGAIQKTDPVALTYVQRRAAALRSLLGGDDAFGFGEPTTSTTGPNGERRPSSQRWYEWDAKKGGKKTARPPISVVTVDDYRAFRGLSAFTGGKDLAKADGTQRQRVHEGLYFLPNAALRKLDGLTVVVQERSLGSAYYNPGVHAVVVQRQTGDTAQLGATPSPDAPLDRFGEVIQHETTHAIGDYDPATKLLENAALYSRGRDATGKAQVTYGGGKSFGEGIWDGAYAINRFTTPYAGRVYNYTDGKMAKYADAGATEMLTVGMEHLTGTGRAGEVIDTGLSNLAAGWLAMMIGSQPKSA